MKKTLTLLLFAICTALTCGAQLNNKVYDETVNPMEQIDRAVAQAKTQGKHVMCQVGGNWCGWCLRFADFITKDTTVARTIDDNFVYIHVNYNPRKTADAAQAQQAAALMERLGQPARFGFPALVVLDETGHVIHIQDSALLEEGDSYNRDKVLRFFRNWTPKAVKGKG